MAIIDEQDHDEEELSKEDKDLNTRQRRFVAAMLCSKTIGEASALVGVTERSGQRWMTLPAVKRTLSAALDQLVTETTRAVAWTMRDALLVLHSIALDEDQPVGARVSACRGILSSGLQLREAVNLTDRLAEIEAMVIEGVQIR